MTIISLIIAIGLSLVADAFQLQSDVYVAKGHFAKGCVKALTAEIECDSYTRQLGQFDSQGWLGNVRLADAMCTATCFDSLQSWNETVTKECAEDRNRSDPYPLENLIREASRIGMMWNTTCIRDTKSGRYCLDIMDEVNNRSWAEKKPYKEPCHPCYGMVLTALLNTSMETEFWGLDDDYWKGQLELVHKKCGGPLKIEEHLEEAKAYNASHKTASELESEKNDAAPLLVNRLGGVWVAGLIYGLGIFML